MVKVHFCVFGGEASNHFKLSQELSHPSRVSLPRYPLSQDSHHGGLCDHRSVLCPGSPASWGEGAPTGPLLPHGLRASVRAPRPRPPPLPSQLCSWKPIVLTGVALGLAAGHLPSLAHCTRLLPGVSARASLWYRRRRTGCCPYVSS